MKSFKKLTVFVLCVFTVMAFASCTKNPVSGETKLKIGIIQIAPHASLDNCYEGIIAGLKQAGYEDGKNIKIYYQNANGEPSTGDMIARNMVSSKYDMLIGIATPTAMSAYSAAKNTDIPVVFSGFPTRLRQGL